MKKLLFIFVFLLSFSFSYAINPIPSYYTTVSGTASFAEEINNIGGPTDDRRDMEVQSPPNSTNGGLPTFATVYMYRLDGSRVIGPLYLQDGGFISQRIDGKPWGCSIRCNTVFLVSVWITSGGDEMNNTTTANYFNYNCTNDWGLTNLI